MGSNVQYAHTNPLEPLPVEWLEIFGVSSASISKLKELRTAYNTFGVKGNMRSFIKSLPRHEFKAVRALARASYVSAKTKNDKYIYYIPVV